MAGDLDKGKNTDVTKEEAFRLLFQAKWNIPRAAKALGLEANEETWQELKHSFSEWCSVQPLTYTEFK